jgi:hypothetical protein
MRPRARLARAGLIGCLLLGAGLCSACAPTSPPTSAGASVSSDPGRGDAVWLSFSRTDGRAATLDRVVVTHDGLVVVTPDGGTAVRHQLDTDQLEALRRQVDEADIPSRTGTYLGSGATGYEYLISADGSFVDADEAHTPEQLRGLVDTLNAFADTPGPSPFPAAGAGTS